MKNINSNKVFLFSFLIFFNIFISFSQANNFWYEDSILVENSYFEKFIIEYVAFPRNELNQNVIGICNNYLNQSKVEFLKINNPNIKCVYDIKTNYVFEKIKESTQEKTYFENDLLKDYKLLTILDFDNNKYFNDNNEVETIFSIYKFLKNYIVYENNNYTLKELSIKEILDYKIGVCDEYTNIFNEFMRYLGYEVRYLNGYVYQPFLNLENLNNNSIDNINNNLIDNINNNLIDDNLVDNDQIDSRFQAHAWSQVKINDKWINVDLTFYEFLWIDNNHIIFNMNEEKIDNKDILISYNSKFEDYEIENNLKNTKQFILKNENDIDNNDNNNINSNFDSFKIDYYLEKPEIIDKEYSIVKIIFNNENNFYIPLEFRMNNYKEIEYFDLNYEYKKYLFKEYYKRLNYSNINQTNNIYDFINNIGNIEYENKFSTLLKPNSKKEFYVLIKNKYEKSYETNIEFKLDSLIDIIEFNNKSVNIELKKSVSNSLIEIKDLLISMFYKNENFESCDIRFNEEIVINCDYEICYKSECSKELKIEYNEINYNESIKKKDFNENIKFESIDFIKYIRIKEKENISHIYKNNLTINNLDSKFVFIEFDFIIKPKEIYLNGNLLKTNQVELIKGKNELSIDFVYDDKIISKIIRIDVENLSIKNDNFSVIYKDFFIIFVVFIIFIYFFKKVKYKKEQIKINHKTFSNSIKVLAVDIFNNLKKIKETRIGFDIKKSFRKIISELEGINNKYIEIFYNSYELD
ncbi:MAG: transglutaminase-like domain-containing protein, partial [Candidatus Nanoarchaeia archaeon]|nr:transglutaminase-like domain-containing protein [Candidatus Nanoarchaeia archaeon]